VLLKEIAQLSEAPKFSEEDIAIGGTVIYARDGKYRKSTAVAKRTLSVTCANGDQVPMHLIVSTDASDWSQYKDALVRGDYSSYSR